MATTGPAQLLKGVFILSSQWKNKLGQCQSSHIYVKKNNEARGKIKQVEQPPFCLFVVGRENTKCYFLVLTCAA